MKKDPMKDKKAGVQTMPCVVFALRASNASKAKSNKTNNNFKPMSNSKVSIVRGWEIFVQQENKICGGSKSPRDNIPFRRLYFTSDIFQLCQQRRLLQLSRGWRNSCFKCVLPPDKLQKRCPSTHRWEPTIQIFDKTGMPNVLNVFLTNLYTWSFSLCIMQFFWSMWLLSTFELQYLGNPPPSQSNISNWRQKLGSECLKRQK